MSIVHKNKKRDLKFGYKSECELLPLFKKKYGDNIKKSTDKYSFFDFYDDNSLLELKTRRITHNQYSTAICNLSKIEKLFNDKRKAFLIFSYLDGVFEISITENYKDWKTSTQTRRDRGRVESSVVCLIPYSEMKKLF